ncbi:hypothetical protein D3C86_2146230 [compost metagenome]
MKPWIVPFSVPRLHVRRVRLSHLASTWRRRSSSRLSAPKAFTTELQLMASAKAPPSFVSQALASFAAGDTKPIESATVTPI